MTTKRTAEERASEWLLSKGMWPEQLSSRINTGTSDKAPTVVELLATCIREEVEPREDHILDLEARLELKDQELAKLRGLVQGLLDSNVKMNNAAFTFTSLSSVRPRMDWLVEAVNACDYAIDAAKQEGFVPTNTTQDNG